MHAFGPRLLEFATFSKAMGTMVMVMLGEVGFWDDTFVEERRRGWFVGVFFWTYVSFRLFVSYGIVSYRIVSYRIVSYRTVPHRFVSFVNARALPPPRSFVPPPPFFSPTRTNGCRLL